MKIILDAVVILFVSFNDPFDSLSAIGANVSKFDRTSGTKKVAARDKYDILLTFGADGALLFFLSFCPQFLLTGY